MAHDESRHIRRHLILDKGRDVADDNGGSTGESPVSLCGRAAAPAALIPGEDLDAGGGELWEECVVAVDVLGEAMDENELCFDGARWLGES